MELIKHAWEWFCTQLSSALLVNVIIAFFSWLFGFLGRQFIDWIRRLIRQRRNKETKAEYADSIVYFDTATPCYDPDKVSMFMTEQRFVFEIPETKRKELAAQKTKTGEQKFAIHEPAKLDGDNHLLYDFLLKYYPKQFPDILSIDTFINEKICSTADYFIERLKQGKLAFNNKQIGVNQVYINRTDKERGKGAEKQTLELELYETDYFTAQVMVHVYQYLRQLDFDYKKKDHQYISPFDDIDEEKLNNEMRHFMSSLGIGGYIIFDRGNKKGLEYWTVTRSKSVRNGSDKDIELRSYSFDETMDLKDKVGDIKDDNVYSAFVGANRAIQEELGLFNERDEKVKGNVSQLKLTGLILIRTNDPQNARFEMQLLGYIFVHFLNGFTYNDLLEKKTKAQDAAFEAVDIYTNFLRDKLTGTVRHKYTHTPESVYYAETLRILEDMKEIKREYDKEERRILAEKQRIRK